MRLFLVCFLVACSGPVDDVVTTTTVDATTTRDTSTGFSDVATTEAEAGPIYTGGPLACGKCTCDGTLYACIEGCVPPPSDAGTDSDADDAAPKNCGNVACFQIPTACLPKPTCDCLTQELNRTCVLAPDGSGFILGCP